ncbi:MAG: hypothetical protein K8T26_03105 [Lentisphaerae bacterium]|nr:hypothetical protein [Lentisphaerota bacterium]
MPDLRIAVVLPYLFSIRDFLHTPVWEEMARHPETEFHLLGLPAPVAELVNRRGVANIKPSTRSLQGYLQSPPAGAGGSGRIAARICAALGRWDRDYLYPACSLRFIASNDLSHYRIRRDSTPAGRERRQIMMEYRHGERPGFPCPRSRALASLLYRAREWPRLPSRAEDLAWLSELNPDVFVFGRLHWQHTAYWARALRRRHIPMIGLVSSWDHPTTKGATSRGMSGYIVASRRMVEEMRDLHGLAEARLRQTGKVQMDRYRDNAFVGTRDALFQRLGIPAEHRLVTLGTNTTGLKEHEVSIARRLATDFLAGRYGRSTLLIRTHPQDLDWARDFRPLAAPPHVLVQRATDFAARPGGADVPEEQADVQGLAALMKHSSIVIQSRGSLALDAIAFDTPVISLAFDGDLTVDPRDSFLQEYAYEHFRPLVKARGTWMVGSFAALDRAVSGYLADPARHADGRAAIRRDHIDPCDGLSSRRVVDALVAYAQQARAGSLPPGDWAHPGIGDPAWAARQACDLEPYMER